MLDPQARELLDALAALGLPPMSALSVEEARAVSAARRAGKPPPPEVASVEDQVLGGVPVRRYRPRPGDPGPGVVVYLHGGGWVLGDLDSHDDVARALALRSGVEVVSVDYRLAPEHPWPAAVDDAWTVVQALAGEGRRVVVAGDSAGANLAAVCALRARDARRPSIALQVLLYPVTDADLDTPSYRELAEGHFLTRDSMAWFWQHYVPEPSARFHPEASPLRAPDLAGVAPALVITAGYDPLRDEGDAYAQRLSHAGVPVVHRCEPGMIHGFVSMSHVLDAGRRVLDELGDEIRSALSSR